MKDHDQFNSLLDFIMYHMTTGQFEEMVARIRSKGLKLPDRVDHIRFLESMRTWSKLDDVEEYLRQHFSYSFSLEPEPQQPLSPAQPPTPQRIPFTNRQDEMELILYSLAPAYYLLDAPAGYGKTELLKELERRFGERGWVVAYVSVEEKDTLSGLVTALAKRLDLDANSILAQSVRLPPGLCLSGALKLQREDDITKKGLVLLIDLEKRPSLPIVKELLGGFIPNVQENLCTLEFFASKHNRFRVILAGRHLAARQEVKESRPLQLKPLRLSPFDYDVIRDSARGYLVEHESVINQLSAHLLYLTGGHPGCMAQVLEMYKQKGLPPDRFVEFFSENIWKDVVCNTVDDIRSGIPDDPKGLLEVLERLCVFRYLDYTILRHMIEDEELAKIGSEHDLADELTATYLLDWKGRLLRDDITRRLLAIRLRHELPEEFSTRCQQARNMCANRMREPNVQMPEMWGIEYLFQSLQQHTGVIQNLAQRSEIGGVFLNEDVPKALRMFVDDRKVPPESVRGEQNAFNQALEEDWEFRFTVNYCLRKDQYNDEPYEKLQRNIDDFFSSRV